MNLGRHAAVLWRFRWVTMCGIALTIVVAFLASYDVRWKDGVSVTQRGAETWKAESRILVTQPGFPEGRVVLPTAPVEGASQPARGSGRRGSSPQDRVEFADPARLAGLADLYSRLVTGDDVLSRVPEHPKSRDVEASPFASSQGGLLLPVVLLTTMAADKQRAELINRHVFESLGAVLTENQERSGVAPAKRVQLRLVEAPKATLAAGRKFTASLLAIVLGLLATLALTHLLAAVRGPRQDPELAAMLLRDVASPGTDLEPVHANGSASNRSHAQNGTGVASAPRTRGVIGRWLKL